jgi:hypothetical protein
MLGGGGFREGKILDDGRLKTEGIRDADALGGGSTVSVV